LREHIEQIMSAPNHAQLQVYEELALSRATALKAMEICTPLLFELDPNSEDAKKITPDMKAMMLNLMRNSLDHVKEMVLAAAKIEALAKDKVSINAINLLVIQIMRAIEDVCGPETDIAKRICEAIEERVRMPINNTDDVAVNIAIKPMLMPGQEPNTNFKLNMKPTVSRVVDVSDND